ncbi:MAG TPA: PilZ domain-containing protein [Anaerovoracaceae bacterium]|nr:PilZ domain-containing protein [Anaerovoracaceae bacterium]
MDANEEKRMISRASYTVRAQAEYNGEIFQGEIINFSLNGLLFGSDRPMDIAEQERTTVTLFWDDKDKGVISTIDCIVVRKIHYILGLRFEAVDYDTLMLLKEKLAGRIGDKVNEEFIDFIFGNR